MIPDTGANLRKGVAEFAVLALLRREPMYGWQISEQLTRGGFIASIGTLYPMLSRLRAKGWVTTFDRASDAGPTRRYYQLTAGGRTALDDFRVQWGRFSASLDALLEEDETHD